MAFANSSKHGFCAGWMKGANRLLSRPLAEAQISAWALGILRHKCRFATGSLETGSFALRGGGGIC